MRTRIYAFFLVASISLSAPVACAAVAHADGFPTASADARADGWVSRLFGWHTPLAGFTGYFSGLFEAREDNVENNNMERDQLLNERRAIAPFDTASTSPSLLGQNAYFIASSSPSVLFPDMFGTTKIGRTVRGPLRSLIEFLSGSAKEPS